MTEKRLMKLILLSLAAVLATACSFSFSTASIAEAQMAKGVSEKMEPINPTSTFETSDEALHCIVKLANAPDKTIVKAVWGVVNAEGQTPNSKLVETPVEIEDGKNILHFSLTPPPAGLSVGEYKVDIYLNPQPGKEEPPAKTVTFSVKAGRPMISEVVLSSSEDGSSVTEFPAETSAFFCAATVRGATAGTKVSANWVAVETDATEPNHEINRAAVVLEAGQNKANFSLTLDDGFPSGRYRVDIYIGDSTTPEKSVAFSVAK